MIDRLNGRAAVGIAALGLLLVVIVGWFFVVSPQRSKAAELAVKIDDAETQLEVTQELIRGPLLQQSTAELATLRTAIPDEVRMSQILRQLSRASGKSRVRILGITPQPVVSASGADVVPMNIAVEGRYFGIREFLRLLHSGADVRGDDKVRASGRLFAVDGIQFLGAGADGAGSNLIQATLTVNGFAYSQPVTVPAAGTDGTSAGVAAVEPGSEAAGE